MTNSSDDITPFSRYLPIAWEVFHRDARILSHKLMKYNFKGIIAIARGGLIPASIVARELELRTIECISVAAYEEEEIGEVRILKELETSIVGDGESWLIIDDIVDTSTTARVVRSRVPKAHFAVVYAKPDGKAIVDTYVTEVSQHTWLLFPWDMELQANEPLKKKNIAQDPTR